MHSLTHSALGSRPSLAVHAATEKSTGNAPVEGRKFRRNLAKTGRYLKRTLNDEDSITQMDNDGVGYSKSGLVAQMRETGFTWTQGDVTVKLAPAYGFCWGVERAVQMAYEARNSNPDKKIHITNEIIHNPGVNTKLKDMGFEFIDQETDEAGNVSKDFDNVKSGEVVLLPAFGAAMDEMSLLNDRGVNIVDTTCPWVSKVWNAVERHTTKSFTSVIHGKWNHEETVATASFATDYICIKNMDECEYLCDYILNGGDRDEFLAKFANATSAGFDPDVLLERVGLANQTTMLQTETLAIGKMIEKTMMKKYGVEKFAEHYMVMDTICDATQERQDAMTEITAKQGTDEGLDMMIVVGGFNSSNTSHLQEMAEVKDIPSFWVDTADRIDVAGNSVLHKTSWGELVETKDWIKKGKLNIGVTSGASTPDRQIEDVLDKVFVISDPGFKGIEKKAVGGLEVKREDHEED